MYETPKDALPQAKRFLSVLGEYQTSLAKLEWVIGAPVTSTGSVRRLSRVER
jgi:hypothetical protein